MNKIDEIKRRLAMVPSGLRTILPDGEVLAGRHKVATNDSTATARHGMGKIPANLTKRVRWDNAEVIFYENAAEDIAYLLERVEELEKKIEGSKPRPRRAIRL